MAVSQRKPPKTWSLFGDVKRRPSVYEVTAGRFNYHFRREPAPFEMDPQAPLNLWYLRYREGSPFTVEDWEGFRDPARLTYADYVAVQHDRETYLDSLIDHHESAGTVATLEPGWVETLRRLFVPLRFPLHVLQMTGLYVGQMAPVAFIVNCANFQAADEMRRVQRLAYWTKVLSNAHGEELALTATARVPWERDAAWQPLREAMERMLATYDWAEAFTALNLAVKPALDSVVNGQLAALAHDHGDELLGLMLADFRIDSERSRNWTAALVRYALTSDPELREVLQGWLATWQPRADAAVHALADQFASAPRPVAAAQVVAAAAEQRRTLLEACGL